MLVRRCGLTRPDDLVGLRGVEHMQFARRHKPLEARIRRPLAQPPRRPPPATPPSRARTLPAPSTRTDTPALPAPGDPGVSRNLVPDLPMAGSVLTLAAPLLRSGIQIATVTGRSFTDIGLFPYAPWVEAGNGSGRQMSSFNRCHDEWWRHRFPGG